LAELEKMLVEKSKKPTGFSPWNPPDLGWMLRVIIFLKPEIESNIINYRKVKTNFKDKILEI